MDLYLSFQAQLAQLFTINPSVKYALDPTLVIADLQSAAVGDIALALNALPQHLAPAGLGPIPPADNETQVPTMWSFQVRADALWFCGYLRGRIPGIQLVLYETVAPAAHWWYIHFDYIHTYYIHD